MKPWCLFEDAEVWDRLRTFSAGGGYVFNTVHNVQAGTPVENLLAMFEALQEGGAG